jgi:hypothetical protein
MYCCTQRRLNITLVGEQSLGIAQSRPLIGRLEKEMERETRLELATSTLARLRSTN